MKLYLFWTCSVVLLAIKSGSTANILAVIPVPSFSHQFAFRNLWRELSLRGHQVTLLTPDPMEDNNLTNLTEISWNGAYQLMNGFKDIFNFHDTFTPFGVFKKMHDFGLKVLEYEMQVPDVQKLMSDKDVDFDLVIGEYLSPHATAFAVRFHCPMIAIVSVDGTVSLHDLMGNPTHPILYPHFDITYSVVPNFYERLQNVFFVWAFRAFIKSYNWNKDFNYVIKELFRLDQNYTYESGDKHVKMSLINANPVFFNTRPLAPGTINIGGWLHMEAGKSLPTDLQLFMDNAGNGVIYFSLGTNIASTDVDNTILHDMAEVLGNLPYKVLWKIDPQYLQRNFSNIKTAKWFPQQDVLRHPNIKLFIMQGGLQSLEEALYYHVPVIGIPMFGDQFNNVLKVEQRGFGIGLDHNNFEKQTFKAAILEVITNPKYKQKTKELMELMLDQPMRPVEKAVWWVEYVIRHKNDDLSHLKGQKTEFYKYFLLDVIGFVMCILVIGIYLIVLTLKLVKRAFTAIFWKQKIKTA